MTSTDIKLQERLLYLRRLLDLRVRLLMKYIESVDVWVEKNMVYVRWISKKPLDLDKERYFEYEQKEFPVSHLSKQIQAYRRKVRNEIKMRHEATKKPKL